MKGKVLAFIVVFVVTINSAGAADGDGYFGFGFGTTDGNAFFYESGTPIKLFVGYDVSKNISIEGAYAYTGDMRFDESARPSYGTAEGISFSISGISTSVVLKYPIYTDKLYGFSSVGLYSWKYQETTAGSPVPDTLKGGVDPVLGIGGGYAISDNFAFRGLWTRYLIETTPFNMWTIELVISL